MRSLIGSFKAILALPVTEDDIRHINKELSRGIHQIKTLINEAGDANDYDLYFSVDISNSVDGSPHYEEIDLIPDGRNRRVSSENVEQYSELMIKHVLYDDYRNSLSFLLKGLFEVIPQEYLAIFSEQELKLILEGEPVIDVDDWKRNTVYTNEFFDQHPSVIAFWTILKRWNTQQQSLLLRFATGYCNPPVGNQILHSNLDSRFLTLERTGWSNDAFLPFSSSLQCTYSSRRLYYATSASSPYLFP